MTLLCSILSLLSSLIASLLLQGETYEAWPMISILLLANLFNVLSTFYGTVYTTTMHTSFIMRTTLIGALSCVILTPALIPMFGTYGACIAAALGQSFVFALRAVDSRKYLKFDIGWRFLAPTLILLVVQAALSALQPNSWQILSASCFVIIAALQGKRLLPLLSIVRSKVSQRSRSSENRS